MTLAQIKSEVENGNKVFWSHDGYQVIKGKFQWYIKCEMNGHITGLENEDGELNGDEKEFFSIKKTIRYTDKTGRGFKNIFYSSDLYTWENEEDCNDLSLYDFADNCENGDIYEKHDFKLECIKVKKY